MLTRSLHFPNWASCFDVYHWSRTQSVPALQLRRFIRRRRCSVLLPRRGAGGIIDAADFMAGAAVVGGLAPAMLRRDGALNPDARERHEP